MRMLLTYAGPVPADSAGSRMGGVPLAPAGFRWPECTTCSGPLQFVAQLQLDEARTMAVFLCDNDPGGCPAWEPGGGANSALVFASGHVRPAAVPAEGVTVLDGVAGIELAGPVDGDHLDATTAWSGATGRPGGDVLGQWGGEPWWIQDEETPDCAGCGAPMSFVAMLSEGHHQSGAAANFGTGEGYAFVCDPCERGAFLYQC